MNENQSEHLEKRIIQLEANNKLLSKQVRDLQNLHIVAARTIVSLESRILSRKPTRKKRK